MAMRQAHTLSLMYTKPGVDVIPTFVLGIHNPFTSTLLFLEVSSYHRTHAIIRINDSSKYAEIIMYIHC